jgi:hypothetical protein
MHLRVSRLLQDRRLIAADPCGTGQSREVAVIRVQVENEASRTAHGERSGE